MSAYLIKSLAKRRCYVTALSVIAGVSTLTVFAAPSFAAPSSAPKAVVLPCEKTAPKTSGPAWIQLTLQVEKLVSLRSGGPKNAPIQLPTTDIVAFDGYLPADGSDISISSGRETAYLAKMDTVNRGTPTSEISVQPGSVFTGVSGTFHALPTADGKIVVTPDITLNTDLALRKSGSGNTGAELPDRRTTQIHTPFSVQGLHCSAHADLTPVTADAHTDQSLSLYGIRVSAYRTQ